MTAPHDRPRPGFFHLAVPFFLPVWRRVATVVVPLLWAVFEFANGAMLWALVFLAFAITALWQFYTADWKAVATQVARDNDGRT